MKPWKIYTMLAAVAVSFGVGVYAGWFFFHPKPAAGPQVSAQVILTALKDRGFLVTETYVFDEPVTIDKTSGSAVSDFFFGQKITARGAMEVNEGVDLSKLTADDISIQGNVVTITIPPATVFNSDLVGPLNVQNDQGILKRILQSDDGYNEALAELSKQAQAAAIQPDLLQKASDNAKDEITRLLGFVAQGKTITVTVGP
ncbi:MAG: DUF4230 domain-containing protein [Patescibacteria group bacterium]